MPTMNAVLGKNGAGETFEALRDTWHLSPPTQRTKAYFEAWLVSRVRANLDAELEAGLVTIGQFRRRARDIDTDTAAGVYSYFGECWEKAIGNTEGTKQLFYLLLKPHHKDMTPALAEELIDAGGQLVKWAFKSVLWQADPSRYSPPGDRPGAGGAKEQSEKADAPPSVPADAPADVPAP